jgi:ATP-binding cassette subfamily F protein 3
MLTISNLDYRIGPRVLFENASAFIPAGWKVGFIGKNGTGKSTLLKIIREEVAKPSPDSAIRLNAGARLGHVAQEIPATDQTLLDAVLAADSERAALLLEAETATDPDRIGEIHERLTDIDAWTAEARAAEVLNGLGFSQADLTRATREFSGGWRMRAALGGVLFSQPDLLLLDEPTNYLDLEGAAWLESYISKYPYTVLIVSHDRALLNRCVTHTLALEHRQLTLTAGGYDDWLKQAAAKRAQLESQRAKQEKERAHLQAFVDRFKAKASKARQAQSRVKMLEKMQDIAIPIGERTAPFTFHSPEDQRAPPLLELDDAKLGYGGDAVILSKVHLRLDPEDRVAIVGANGQGKTTLVKSIAERLPLMAGTRKAHKALRIGYFSQDQLDELTAGESILEHVRRALPHDTSIAQQRSVAAQLGFSHEKIDTPVEQCSGGEKVRLLLGLMGLKKPHILILDEPTSHLDIDSREALIYALNDFDGAVLLITHDVYLAEASADRLWLVKDGRAGVYEGDLADYRALVMAADRAAPEKANGRSAPPAARRKADATALKKKVSEAEKRLERAMAALGQIDAQLAKASPAELAALGRDRTKAAKELDAAEAAWIEASEAYEAQG